MIEKKIDNWTYRILDNHNLEIEPPEDVKLPTPDTLYKYYALDEFPIQVLENLELFASYPKILNDPFDTYHGLIQFDDKEAIKRFFGKILNDPEIKKAYEDNHPSLKGFAEYSFTTTIYGYLGILSMTEKPTNLLMWSYYTNHQGFCIEFNYKKFPFKYHGPFQIKYSDKFKEISIKNGGHICMLYQSTVKAIDWQHELEWRLLPEKDSAPMEMKELDVLKDIKNTVNRKFPINKESIEKVILGNRFFDNDDEIRATKEGLAVTLKKNVDYKNRLLSAIDKLGVRIELIFRDEPYFGFRTEAIAIERLGENDFQIRKIK